MDEMEVEAWRSCSSSSSNNLAGCGFFEAWPYS